MGEQERIAMQADLTKIPDEWVNNQAETYSIFCCSELGRMMASAALAVVEASTRAEAEAEH